MNNYGGWGPIVGLIVGIVVVVYGIWMTTKDE